MPRIFTITIISALSCTLLACGDTDETPAGNDLQTCAEDDFESSPLAGAGYNPETGLVGPAQDKYIAHTTFIILDPDQMQRFGQLMGPVLADLETREGLVAYSLGLSQKCGIGRTVGIWESEQAMAAFVVSDAHLAAVAEAPVVALNGAFTHWDITPDEVPISWDTAREKIAKSPALY
jgi:quinol monooxygenase YgiN